LLLAKGRSIRRERERENRYTPGLATILEKSVTAVGSLGNISREDLLERFSPGWNVPDCDARDSIDDYIDYVIDIRRASRDYPRGFVLIEASR